MSDNIQNKRNYGIELLRIFSMLLVVLLHVLGQGGILSGAEMGTAEYKVAWLLEAAAFCAANCYALISGYVGVTSKYKYANIMTITLQVIFYTLTITALFSHYKPEVITEGVYIRALFPFVYNQYWYFTAYFCTAFFIPFMNKLLLALDKKEIKALAITILLIFTVLPVVFATDVFNLGWGYSAAWISVLYIFGGCLKLLGANRFKKRVYILIYLICVVLTWLNKFLLPYPKNSSLMSYLSPTVLLAAAALLLLFSKLDIKKCQSRIIGFFAPLTFGVFLVHTHPYMWHNWLYNRYAEFLTYSPLKMALASLSATVVIWFVCSMLDYVRLLLFKLLKVKNICILIENKIKKIA